MIRRFAWIASLYLASCAGLAQGAESLSGLLEKAIHAENTAGQLDEAIALYDKIIAASEENRATAAQAYFRRGLCLLKKGDKESAAEAFERVRSQFPDQKQLVESAGRELRRLRPAGTKPPTVVRTSPELFADTVPTTLKEITVTFDQRMTDESWSWTGGGDTYPKTFGKPRYDSAQRTCTLPVELEPGKVYWVGINSPSHKNFRSVAGVPAVRHVIVFATAGADGKPTPIPQEMRQNAEQVIEQSKLAADPSAAAEPVLVGTKPQAFDKAVSSELKELTVTFDRRMSDQSWSWTGGGETYPKVTAKPHYDEGCTTCTLPVELEPGKVYWVGVNSPSHRNFMSAAGTPAPWYIILFATADKDGKPTPIPDEMLTRARSINISAKGRSTTSRPDDALSLLDAETREQIQKFEQGFASFFRTDAAYEAASAGDRAKMVEQWMADARSKDFEKRTRAIAALGNVRAKEAVDTLLEVVEEPMGNHRPKWMAVRALGRIGDPAAVPALIDLVDHGNVNTKVYARLALAQITGEYFGDDKARWRAWLKH